MNHEHILMKQNFLGNFSSAPLKTSPPCAYGHWSKLHVNIINSSGVMTIFFYKGLEIERNTETGSALVWSEFSSISGDSGELRIPNLARMSLIKCYWILQGYSYNRFWVIKGNQQGGGGEGGGGPRKITLIPHHDPD